MKKDFTYKVFKHKNGTRYFAKIVDEKCVFFFIVEDEEKAHKIFRSICYGSDPATDGRRRSENPEENYKAIVAKTKEKNSSVCYYRFIECGNFNNDKKQ